MTVHYFIGLLPENWSSWDVSFVECEREQSVKWSRYMPEQIAFALRQAENVTRVVEIYRRMGICDQRRLHNQPADPSRQVVVGEHSPGVGRALCQRPVLDGGKLDRPSWQARPARKS